MSSSDRKETTVRLVADGNGLAIGIVVLDGRFRVVAEGLGRVEVALAPGLYTVRFQADAVVRDIYAALEPDRDVVRIEAPELPFASPIPLQRTRTTLAEHERHAGEQSRQIHHRRGAGSQLFVFVRDLGSRDRERVAHGLTLHDIAGTVLADFARDGERSPPRQREARWVGCTIELDPGAYRLRTRREGMRSLEQIVITRPGWQTQVFLLHDVYETASRAASPDLFDTAVLMTRLGSSFDPTRLDLRQTELVRLGLAERRIVISADDLGRMVWMSQDNPMLGLYGAHLLLSAPQPDSDLLRRVADGLQRMVGDHPDVAALNIALGIPSAVPRIYQTPPMLRSSWDIVVHESARRPAIVPLGSFAACVADQLWSAGAWVVWQTPVAALQVAPGSNLDLAALRRRLPQILSKLPRSRTVEDIEQLADSYGLSTVERYLLTYVSDVLMPPRPVWITAAPSAEIAPEQTQAQSDDPLSDTAIARTLGVPLAVLCEASAGLIHKLAPLDIERLADAALPQLARLAQLEPLGLLPATPDVQTLRRLAAEPGAQDDPPLAFPPLDTPAERAAFRVRLRARLERDEQLALALDALLHESMPRLSDAQMIAALVAPIARAVYAQLGSAPAALTQALRRHFQSEQVQRQPWQPGVPAARRWLPRIGGCTDPQAQLVTMVHAAVVELLGMERAARQAALADPHKRVLREQAHRGAARAKLPKRRRHDFAEAYVAAIQALAPAITNDF